MANKEFQVRHGLVVNSNVLVANTITGNVGIGTSNPAYTLDVYGTINAANVLMNGGTIAANLAPAFDTANAAFSKANDSIDLINGVRPVANDGYTVANAAFGHSNITYNAVNSAFGVANAAYDHANTKFASTGGTISGNVSILSDLTVHGNTFFIDQQTLVVSDPLIYLAGNNYTSDVVDIGFVANYVNASSVNVHTGLFRSAGTKEYYLFQGYDKEPDGNYIDPTGNNITRAVLNSDVRTSNLNLGGANAIVWIKSAYDTLNAGYTVANASFGKANLALTNVGQTAPGSATQGQMWWNSDLGRLYIYYTSNSISQWVEAAPTAASIEGSIVTGYINPVYDIANAAFTVANSAFAYQNSDYSMSNAAYTVSNAAFAKANAALANTSGVVFAGDLSITGNVSIGNTSPTVRLHVEAPSLNGVNYPYELIRLSYRDGTSNPFDQLINAGLKISWHSPNDNNSGNTSEAAYITSIRLSGAEGTTATHLAFGTDDSIVAGTSNLQERMRITSLGNVGIGNTAPKLKLEVAGNMSVDAFVENSANITTSYTITTGRNAMTAGPVTLDSGITITVPSGSTWTVV